MFFRGGGSGGGGGGGMAAAARAMLVRHFSQKPAQDVRRINPKVPQEEAKDISKDLYQLIKSKDPLTVSSTWDLVKGKVGDVSQRKPFISFVLGGPGSGKGTQCVKIAETFGFEHLSAGDLLRKEITSDGENGAMIREIITEGMIVPSEITVKLIHKAIESSKNHGFLIDGFPRSDENRVAFEKITGVEPDIVLYFDCQEEDMVKRVLSRNQGRIDDNIETIKKRLKIYNELTLPVINYYSGKGKVHKINAIGSEEEVFERVRPLFTTFKTSGGPAQ